jgi:hypothetical protein
MSDDTNDNATDSQPAAPPSKPTAAFPQSKAAFPQSPTFSNAFTSLQKVMSEFSGTKPAY